MDHWRLNIYSDIHMQSTNIDVSVNILIGQMSLLQPAFGVRYLLNIQYSLCLMIHMNGNWFLALGVMFSVDNFLIGHEI